MLVASSLGVARRQNWQSLIHLGAAAPEDLIPSPSPSPNHADGSGPSCPSASATGGLTMVWAQGASISEEDWFEALRATLRETDHRTPVRLYCGTTACLVAADKYVQRAKPGTADACLTAKRLRVQELAAGTPVDYWCRHHILAKVMAGPDYEVHLQVVMQLVALWTHGGLVVQPGVRVPRELRQGGNWMGTSTWDADITSVLAPAHGLLAVSSSVPQADFVGGMLSAAVGEYPRVNGFDHRFNYSRARWPIRLTFEPMLDVARNASAAEPSVRFQLVDFASKPRVRPEMHYAPLSFYKRQEYLLSINNTGMNVGDEMQQLAGLQFMPHVSNFVERDEMSESWGQGGVVQLGANKSCTMFCSTLIFANAWYDKSAQTWPPPDHLNPVLLALHFEVHGERLPRPLFKKKAMKYLQSRWPVGTRDAASLDLLLEQGVPAFFSGDMTLTLAPICKRGSGGRIRVVDVSNESLAAVVPADVIDEAVFGTHKASPPSQLVDHQLARYASAYGHLWQYSCDTKLLITERLHAALPSLAMGLPVLLIDDAATLPGGGGEAGERRIADAKKMVHVATVADGAPAGFDWRNPAPNPGDGMRVLLQRNLREAAACHHPTLADAAVKFGALPEEYADFTAAREPCESSAPAHDTIHVATGLDAALLRTDHGVAFASWAKALGKANTDATLSLNLLVDGLTESQKCLIRVQLRRQLSRSSRVYTIPVDAQLDELAGQYNGLAHVTRVTMARLMLPLILPCVDKILWIDLDALVLKPLAPLFAIEPSCPCGIAARESFLTTYTVHRYKGPNKEAIRKRWLATNKTGFNAGVLVMSLAKLRANGERYKRVVARVGKEYGNDDQVVLNYWCMLEWGNFTRLDGRWNVFHFSGKADEVDPLVHAAMEDWAIFHFDSSNKPWLNASTFANENVNGLWRDYATDLWSSKELLQGQVEGWGDRHQRRVDAGHPPAGDISAFPNDLE